ncbi:MAG: DMT family transporter [Anaerovoracaceae bacterium]|jgi:drug/metabolite transporter (DMT)-like permease
MKKEMTQIKADLILLVVATFWGSGYVVTKVAMEITTPIQFSTYRFTIAAILAIVFFYKKLRNAEKGDWVAGILMGFFLTISMLFQTIGLKYTGAGKGVFIASAFVIMVPFFYWIIGKVKPKLKIINAAVLMLIGLAIMSFDTSGLGGLNKGDLYMLASAVTFAIHTTIIGIYAPKRDPFLLSGIQFITSSILFLLMTPFDAGRGPITPEVIGPVVFSGIVVTFLCFLGQVYCQKYTSPSQAAIIINLETIMGSIIAVIFLHESYDAKMILSFAIIFASVMVAEVSWKELIETVRVKFKS